MGCFSVSCAVSHITINAGEKCFLFPLLPNVNKYEIERGLPDDGSLILGSTSMFLDREELFIPFCFPIEGIYNDYGSIENIKHNENTNAIEKFLGISIELFVEKITDNNKTIDCINGENDNTKKNINKLSCMFIHGDIFKMLSKQEETIQEKPEKIKITKYLLHRLGFVPEKNKGIFKKENIFVEYNDFSCCLQKGNQLIKAYNCSEFFKAYHSLTGNNLQIIKDLPYDNTDFLFE